MTEPLSLIALGAAVGGAAGKFVEKAWDSGERWLASYFQNHREKAQETARDNAAAFLNALARRVSLMEQEDGVEGRLGSALDHPDFAASLQQALINSARTDSIEKHELFARLISDRLSSESESTLALVTRMASEAISLATSKQLRILGLLTTILVIRPTQILASSDFLGWLQVKLLPYRDLNFTRFDLMHLEALDCLRFEPSSQRILAQILEAKDRSNVAIDSFLGGSLGAAIDGLWAQQRLSRYTPTSTGLLVGLYVADQLTNSVTEFEIWE